MSLILILVLPFLGSIIAALLPANARNLEAWLAGLVALSCAGLTALQAPAIAQGLIIEYHTPWIPGALAIDFSLRMDGYAWLFAMLVTLMGALIALYTRYYLSAADPVPRFFSFFQFFMASMLGIVLSGNLVQLVIFWELTSLSSFMLIAYWNHRIDARRGARMALIVTGSGGLCLLAGVLMLGHVVGSYNLDDVLDAGDIVRAHPWYSTIFALIALGALTKSAQFPFQFWLPNAMAAPTPVSAYLHSATMVKAGVFLLARFWPVLAGTELWFWVIGGAGLISLVLGAYAAIFQEDMKGVLAYSTISNLGLIALLLGLNSTLGLVAAIFHMLNHATFKASLFMAAGIVDHESGTRNLRRLSGLRHAMPITTVLAVVASGAMAVVPLLNGFISKEMFFSETIFVNKNLFTDLLPSLAVIAAGFSVAYSYRFVTQVFFGRPARRLPRQPHDPPIWMLLPSGLLVLACVVVGVLPQATLGNVLHWATLSILGAQTPHYDLKIWHGFNLPLLMSVIAIIGGLLLIYYLRHKRRLHVRRTPFIYHFDGRHTFERLLDTIDSVSTTTLGWLYSSRLQPQLVLIVLCTLAVAAMALWQGSWLVVEVATPPNVFFTCLWIVGAACAIGSAYQAKYHRFTSLALAGGAGLATALTFAWLSAPDLALTQLVVEAVTVVLILLGLRWLPPRLRALDKAASRSAIARTRRVRDFVIALASGAGIASLAYAILSRQPISDGLGPFFLEHSLPSAFGANVVNVILVDFRGFDTLGEITVLGLVALSVFALFRRFRPPHETLDHGPVHQQQGAVHDASAESTPTDPQQLLPDGVLRMPAVLGRLLLPMAAMVSVFFLLRGHNLPGGGFVGGLIFASAITVQYMVGGVTWVESRQNLHPQKWIAFGMIFAAGSALSAWWVQRPFLSASIADLKLPLIGSLHLSSTLFFDLGVYLLVVGSTILILVALGHQSVRFRRKQSMPSAAKTSAANPTTVSSEHS